MPKNLTCFRVFIASPGGLSEERKAFREEIDDYNNTDAIERGFYFRPVGWEDTLGGVGRPQKFINEDIEKSDFLVLLLWDRWGSSPYSSNSHFTSGTEEEYHLALDCYASDKLPMKDIVLMFKSVDPHQMADPGLQLKKVLDFKKEHEKKKTHHFHTFDSIDNYRKQLRRYLSSWIRDEEKGLGIDISIPPLVNPTEYRVDNTDITEQASPNVPKDPVLVKAWTLADEGRLTEAEIEFAKALVSGHTLKAFNAYGRFLCRVGRLDQAISMFKGMISVAEEQNDRLTLSNSYNNLGNVLQTRGNYKDAELMFLKSVDINENLGRQEGKAIAYCNLGNMLQARKDFVGAMQMYQKSLEIHEQQNNQEGLAIVSGNLGNMSQNLGDTDGAKRMYNISLVLYIKKRDREGIAICLSNIGNILYLQGDLDGAERILRKSLKIHQRIGCQDGKAIVYKNLGNVMKKRGNLDGAKESYIKAGEIHKQLGNLLGVADHYNNIGIVLLEKGHTDEADQMHRKSLEFNKTIGNIEGMAIQYKNIGNVLRIKGDFDGATQMYMHSIELGIALNSTAIIRNSEKLLHTLPNVPGREGSCY